MIRWRWDGMRVNSITVGEQRLFGSEVVGARNILLRALVCRLVIEHYSSNAQKSIGVNDRRVATTAGCKSPSRPP
jgi:hypothetical protein